MKSTSVYLGWHHVTDTTPAGAAITLLLCRALGVETHWEPVAGYLFVRSPVKGRTIVLGSDSPLSEALRRAVALLRSAGASVYTVTANEPLEPQLARMRQTCPDALVYLRAAAGREVRVTAYGPLSRRTRDLAACVARAVAGAAGLVLQPPRPAWIEELPLRRAGGPAALVDAGPADPALLAGGLFAGISRHFAPPELACLLDQFARSRRLAAALRTAVPDPPSPPPGPTAATPAAQAPPPEPTPATVPEVPSSGAEASPAEDAAFRTLAPAAGVTVSRRTPHDLVPARPAPSPPPAAPGHEKGPPTESAGGPPPPVWRPGTGPSIKAVYHRPRPHWHASRL